jgi:hypothetical protein
MNRLLELLFTADVIILTVLLVGTVWSVAFPERRIWPPPQSAPGNTCLRGPASIPFSH